LGERLRKQPRATKAIQATRPPAVAPDITTTGGLLETLDGLIDSEKN
jgi:hypothetical protein